MANSGLEERVTRAAEAALAEQGYVSAIDVLLRLGWLAPPHLALWRQGRVECLERVVQAGLGKQSTAMHTLRTWAIRRGLTPSETVYVARTRDRRRLRFSVSGKPDIELVYRTHWVSPDLSAGKAERLRAATNQPPDLVVVAPLNEWTCAGCSTTGNDLLLMQDNEPHCMRCARLDHLVFLPAGDAKRTRQAHRASSADRCRGPLQPHPQALRTARPARGTRRPGSADDGDAVSAKEMRTRRSVTRSARPLARRATPHAPPILRVLSPTAWSHISSAGRAISMVPPGSTLPSAGRGRLTERSGGCGRFDADPAGPGAGRPGAR